GSAAGRASWPASAGSPAGSTSASVSSPRCPADSGSSRDRRGSGAASPLPRACRPDRALDGLRTLECGGLGVGGFLMRVAVAAGLTIAALLCALVGPGSPPAAQPGRGDAPAAAASVGPDDVVVEDWQSGPLGQKGVPSGWEAQTWGKASGLDLSVVLDEGSRVLHLASHNDRTTITRDLHGRISLARTPILRWRWKVIAAPTGGDARRRETADQAAQLYVTWPRPPALLRSRIIGYAWDTSAPAGSRFPSQKTGTVTYVILRSGTA